MPRLELEDPADALDMVFVFEDLDGSKRYARPTEVTVRAKGAGWDLLFEGSERIRHDTNKWPKVHQYRPANWILQGSLAWPPTCPERFAPIKEDEAFEDYVARMSESFEATEQLSDEDWMNVFVFQVEKRDADFLRHQRKVETAERNRARRLELERQRNLRF